MDKRYGGWLADQRLGEKTIQSQLSWAGRVEKFYGDLDGLYDEDRLASVISKLNYSTEDARNSKPNPTDIPITGNLRTNLASYKNAIVKYCIFKGKSADIETSFGHGNYGSKERSEVEEEPEIQFGLERDMQAVLRQSISQLEDGLVVIDEGAERAVDSGFIDITARDSKGAIVVIELKTGTARRKDIGQILGYMGDVEEEETDSQIRGILVAGGFDNKIQAAARMVPNLTLQEYSFHFKFSTGL